MTEIVPHIGDFSKDASLVNVAGLSGQYMDDLGYDRRASETVLATSNGAGTVINSGAQQIIFRYGLNDSVMDLRHSYVVMKITTAVHGDFNAAGRVALPTTCLASVIQGFEVKVNGHTIINNDNICYVLPSVLANQFSPDVQLAAGYSSIYGFMPPYAAAVGSFGRTLQCERILNQVSMTSNGRALLPGDAATYDRTLVIPLEALFQCSTAHREIPLFNFGANLEIKITLSPSPEIFRDTSAAIALNDLTAAPRAVASITKIVNQAAPTIVTSYNYDCHLFITSSTITKMAMDKYNAEKFSPARSIRTRPIVPFKSTNTVIYAPSTASSLQLLLDQSFIRLHGIEFGVFNKRGSEATGDRWIPLNVIRSAYISYNGIQYPHPNDEDAVTLRMCYHDLGEGRYLNFDNPVLYDGKVDDADDAGRIEYGNQYLGISLRRSTHHSNTVPIGAGAGNLRLNLKFVTGALSAANAALRDIVVTYIYDSLALFAQPGRFTIEY